ncbi:MAG: class I SAM-dependent rRNA methyltransferase [Candidatus Wallbacteria bacterium]|nr:class I SAM-dependent rRNA methyltransferase [Candidatus Wallbacteria bacterium]
MLTLTLKKSEDRRIRTGHIWIFSNEIESVEGKPEPGSLAVVKSFAGQFVGIGYYNKASLIACRILTRHQDSIDSAFFQRRVKAALALRQTFYPGETAYRLVFSEGDQLPGFVADRFGDCVSVQTSTAGAEQLLEPFLEAVQEVLSPRALVLRNDMPARALEGLPSYSKIASGELSGPVESVCDGVRYQVDLVSGQKTGFFFDQRENRQAGARLCEGKRVLDAYCYTGSWALHACRARAASVTAVDSSASAIELARRNARLNAAADQIEFATSDVPAFLDRARETRQSYDVVFLDPPPFARSKKDLKEALIAYERVNKKALDLLPDGGYLVTSSCSFHVSADDFLRCLARAAAPSGRTLRLLELRGQSKDHPALLAMPETRYLKCAVVQKV